MIYDADLRKKLDDALEALRPFADEYQNVQDQPDDWNLWEHPAAMNLSVRDIKDAYITLLAIEGP